MLLNISLLDFSYIAVITLFNILIIFPINEFSLRKYLLKIQYYKNADLKF